MIQDEDSVYYYLPSSTPLRASARSIGAPERPLSSSTRTWSAAPGRPSLARTVAPGVMREGVLRWWVGGWVERVG